MNNTDVLYLDKPDAYSHCYWCGRVGTIMKHPVCWEELKAFALTPQKYTY